MTCGRVALVLGGARSGKSVEAERLVTLWAHGSAVTYVATALLDSGDDGMAERVAAHQDRRPTNWATVDAGDDLPAVLRATHGPVLLDSLGPWVGASFPEPLDTARLVQALTQRDGDTVVVSDEVSMAVHPVSESGRWFVDALGTVNQAVAAVAAEVRLVVAGRVLVLPPADDHESGSEADAPAAEVADPESSAGSGPRCGGEATEGRAADDTGHGTDGDAPSAEPADLYPGAAADGGSSRTAAEPPRSAPPATRALGPDGSV